METQNNSEASKPKKKSFPYKVSKSRYMTIMAVFTAVGVLGGLGYYLLVGCETNQCGITSSPYLTMVWGGLMGYFIPDIFLKYDKEGAGK